MKVLVVDDSRLMRSVIVRELYELGAVKVEQAEDGIEAIRKISADQFDVVILDIKMPKSDGIDVVKHIKKQSVDTKIIMCSSVSDKDVVMPVVQLGIDDYILKPFTLDKLNEVLTPYVAKS